MNSILLTFYYLLFTLIAWRNINHGLILLFALLPTYLIRFNIGPFPTTMLEIMVLIILAVAVLKKETRHKLQTNIKKQISKNKLLFTGIFIFLLAATISIFTSVDIRTAAGEWKAFYIEPILIFLVLIAVLKNNNVTIKQFNNDSKSPTFNVLHSILFGLIFSGLVASILAIYQHFTGWMVPSAFWENRDTFRVTAWYGFPNGVGLFLAPLVPLAIYLVKQSWKKIQTTDYRLQTTLMFASCLLFLVSVPFAILFAKSTGAIVGITAGIGILFLFNKKTRWPAILVGIVGLASLFSFSGLADLKDEVLFKDRSGQIRISMWKEAVELIKDQPILGAGLASYDERIAPYHTTVNGEGIEIFHHPHNIFLTIWVNLGILGLIGFILILIWFFRTVYGLRSMDYGLFLLSAMVIILVTGLVDSPYIKNDLALLFWLLPSTLLITKQETLA